MKRRVFFLFLAFSVTLFAQNSIVKDGDKYWEDQLYFSVTYNILSNQPSDVNRSNFSYGASAGYIKDIPLNIKGKWALGIGTGYNYDSYNHNLAVDDKGDLAILDGISANKIRLHNIEFPIQIRWRNSTATTYSFWRIYAGVRLSYNFSNKFAYTYKEKNFTFYNVSSYNKFQSGIELSIGYGAFNFFMYHGLNTMYKNTKISNTDLNTKTTKLGLIFFFL